jgi:tripartite-type tricarboxylate transporter receptor subunit TctC
MIINRRHFLHAASALAAPTILPRWTFANAWPSRIITFVVPYGPGGTTDATARQFADFLSHRIGQSVIIENRPGVQANLGAESVARAAPDGYTMLLSTAAISNNAFLGPKPKFVADQAFQHVAKLALASNIVLVRQKLGVKTMPEAVKLSREKAGALTMGAGQIDTYVKLLNWRAGADFRLIPYRTSPQALSDAIAGHVDLAMALVPTALSVVGQNLIPLGVSSKERSTILPKVPTYRESGIPDAEVESWFGLSLPKGTPPAIVQRLADEASAFVTDGEMKKRLHSMGIEPAPQGTPDEFGRFISDEARRWEEIAKELGVSIE